MNISHKMEIMYEEYATTRKMLRNTYQSIEFSCKGNGWKRPHTKRCPTNVDPARKRKEIGARWRARRTRIFNALQPVLTKTNYVRIKNSRHATSKVRILQAAQFHIQNLEDVLGNLMASQAIEGKTWTLKDFQNHYSLMQNAHEFQSHFIRKTRSDSIPNSMIETTVQDANMILDQIEDKDQPNAECEAHFQHDVAYEVTLAENSNPEVICSSTQPDEDFKFHTSLGEDSYNGEDDSEFKPMANTNFSIPTPTNNPIKQPDLLIASLESISDHLTNSETSDTNGFVLFYNEVIKNLVPILTPEKLNSSEVTTMIYQRWMELPLEEKHVFHPIPAAVSTTEDCNIPTASEIHGGPNELNLTLLKTFEEDEWDWEPYLSETKADNEFKLPLDLSFKLMAAEE